MLPQNHEMPVTGAYPAQYSNRTAQQLELELRLYALLCARQHGRGARGGPSWTPRRSDHQCLTSTCILPQERGGVFKRTDRASALTAVRAYGITAYRNRPIYLNTNQVNAETSW